PLLSRVEPVAARGSPKLEPLDYVFLLRVWPGTDAPPSDDAPLVVGSPINAARRVAEIRRRLDGDVLAAASERRETAEDAEDAGSAGVAYFLGQNPPPSAPFCPSAAFLSSAPPFCPPPRRGARLRAPLRGRSLPSPEPRRGLPGRGGARRARRSRDRSGRAC